MHHSIPRPWQDDIKNRANHIKIIKTSAFSSLNFVRVDFAFKKCFGSKESKAATIGLLNAMIPGIRVKDVEFLNTELPGLSKEDRKGIIDVLCTGDDDSTFIVEMQRASQPYFRERTYFYSALYVQSQAIPGEWDFHLKPTYVVAFLDFSIEQFGVAMPKGRLPMLHYCTRESTLDEKMPGSTEFLFFDLSNFTKSHSEIADNQDYWLYLLRNSGHMTEVPEQIKGKEFEVFLQAAKIAAFNKDERIQYEKDMVTALDMQNALAWAEQKGETRGKAEGKAEVAKAMLSNGIDISLISSCTGLSEQEIKSLIP